MKESQKEREMIREAAIKSAQRIQSRAAEIDAKEEIPKDWIEALGKQGFLALLLPEDFGGTQGDLVAFCYVVEEVAKACGSSSLMILAQGMGTLPILVGGNNFQQERYFSRIAESHQLVAFAAQEESGEIEPSKMRTRAEKKGSDYVLNGRKHFVTHGGIADLYTVLATTPSDREKSELSAFIVEKGTPGLRFGPREKKIGMRGTVTVDVWLEDCRIPFESLLGKEGDGGQMARRVITAMAPAVGAQAVGIGQAALDFAIGYAHDRIQFGKSIASFQAIQFMIADMATELEAARALVYKAAHVLNDRIEGEERLAAMAKCFATDVAMRVTTDAVQILGGYGYMRDYPVERMMRDAKVSQIFGGSNQIQRLAVADQLVGKTLRG